MSAEEQKTVCAVCGRVMTAENRDWMCLADIARCYPKEVQGATGVAGPASACGGHEIGPLGDQ